MAGYCIEHVQELGAWGKDEIVLRVPLLQSF